MSVSVVYCPDCGLGSFARNGVSATTRWAEHFRREHLQSADADGDRSTHAEKMRESAS